MIASKKDIIRRQFVPHGRYGKNPCRPHLHVRRLKSRSTPSFLGLAFARFVTRWSMCRETFVSSLQTSAKSIVLCADTSNEAFGFLGVLPSTRPCTGSTSTARRVLLTVSIASERAYSDGGSTALRDDIILLAVSGIRWTVFV